MRSRAPFEAQWSATLVLVIINIVVFVIQNVADGLGGSHIDQYFALSITGLKHGYVWQLITFQFLHAGVFHILGNLFTIYFVGRAVEEAVGKASFLKLYLLSGVFGGLLQMAAGLFWPYYFGQAVVGASAGGFGLVAAFATLFPQVEMHLFFLPIAFRARTLLWIGITITVVEIVLPFTGVFGPPRIGGLGVAHCAHLGGILTGWFYVLWLTQGQRPLSVWQPFRRNPARRELVKVRSQKPPLWQRPKSAETVELPPAEFISKEVDPILDKISAHGIQSLTERERQILEAARAKMSKR
jgi:membrane associated rhomboid family serine protease